MVGKLYNSIVKKLGWAFIACVVFPTISALLYFGVLASDVYVSESKFIVVSQDRPTVTGLGVLLQSAGLSSASHEVFAARDYIGSRDAMAALDAGGALRAMYSKGDISIVDRFDPFNLDNTAEAFYRYFEKRVTVQQESSASSVNTLMVRAFSGEDAYKINQSLLSGAEGLVNRINERAKADMVRFARREVEDAETVSRKAAVALSRFRNASGVVDPEKQAVVQFEMLSKLQDEIISSRTQLAQLRLLAPDNPQVPLLQARVAELERAMAIEKGNVTGASRSLAASAVEYQRLEMDNQLAGKQLAAAMISLQDARDDARRKQIYIERIVQPSLPDEAAEPRRIRSIVAVFLVGLLVWGILRLLIAGVREHVG